MTTADISDKLVSRVEFMIMQLYPKPTCPTKQAAHAAGVREIKRQVAEKLVPENNGLNIEIKV